MMATKTAKKPAPVLDGMRVWSDAGPGWANSGITYVWRDVADGSTYTTTTCIRDLTDTERTLFRIARDAYEQLESVAMRERRWRQG